MTRLALIVGINYYEHSKPLFGCVNDARAVKEKFERNEDGSLNFECKLLEGANSDERVDRGDLKDQIKALFKSEAEIALFYFAGHGRIEATGGYLLTTDSERGDEGVPLSDILVLANESPARNKIIILDSCHSGIAGTSPTNEKLAALSEGLVILTASTQDQYATEANARGIFTTLLIDALDGSAANLTGDITPGSVYAHVDQSLGGWEQRPVFKTNVKQFVSLRKVKPPISAEDLRRIPEFFTSSDFKFPLDPTYEPEMRGRASHLPEPVEENTRIFALLQKYNRLNLLVPVEAPHMWHAAIESKACKLTALGEHYRRLIMKDRI